MRTRRKLRRSLGAGAALALAASGLAVTTGRTAAADPVTTSAIGSTLKLTGRGFGHGHGMSQYGAQGAALDGLTYSQILAFYYPGTTPRRAHGRIRVLIGADSTADVIVSPAAGLGVRNLATGAARWLGSGRLITRWRIIPTATGGSVVQYLTPTGWHRSKRFAGEAEFFAAEPLTLWVPSTNGLVSRTYRGRLRSAAPAPGSAARDTVNVVGLDAYVSGVLPYEMPTSWPSAALKAQAVAARSFALYTRAANAGRHYQICDTTTCQVYAGTAAEQDASNRAVRATKGIVLRYQRAPALTQFSASSGGRTAAGGLAYLPAKRDPYDVGHGNPYHRWNTTLQVAAINAAFPRLGGLRAVRIPERTGDGQWGGRVERVVLVGRRANVRLTGDEFRLAFGLRSTWFAFG
jgi:SpoIID/LytB domain protein